MAMPWNKTRYSPIAIDFGADSLKLLQIIPGDPPQLVAAASAQMPEEARQDPAARQAFFVESLKSLLKLQPFKGRRAICAIPAYQTLVQHLQIARLEHEDFETQIGLQLRQRLNVDPSRMVIRHFEIAQIVRDGSSKQEVICLAASRDSIMRHLETAQRAKLDVVGMQCEPLAILHAFSHLYRGQSDTERTTCFIDQGAATTKVVIAHGSQMVFAKTIHAAGDHLTRQRAKAQGISFADARESRMREAVAGSQRVVAAAEAAVAPRPESAESGGLAMLEAQIAAERNTATAAAPTAAAAPHHAASDADSETLDCLIDELQLSVRYHQSLFTNRPIEKLIFLGGESNNTAICQKIARSLRIGAQLGDPLARLVRINQGGAALGIDLNRPQPGWAVPFGLCLSEDTV